MMDQSSGHRWMCEGVLNSNLMSVIFGREQSKLRDTIIKDVGTYQWKFDVGDTQATSFLEDDKWPFYLSPQETLCWKYDQLTCKIKKIHKSKKQLMRELKETKGFSVSCHYSKE